MILCGTGAGMGRKKKFRYYTYSYIHRIHRPSYTGRTGPSVVGRPGTSSRLLLAARCGDIVLFVDGIDHRIVDKTLLFAETRLEERLSCLLIHLTSRYVVKDLFKLNTLPTPILSWILGTYLSSMQEDTGVCLARSKQSDVLYGCYRHKRRYIVSMLIVD